MIFRSVEVIAIVPIEKLSWHQVHLPARKLSGQKLRSVLIGILEERLLDAPEILHFAVESNPKEGQLTWVAVCDKVWLQSFVEQKESNGEKINRLIPEFHPTQNATPRIWFVGGGESNKAVFVNSDGVHLRPLNSTNENSLVQLIQNTSELEVFAEPHLLEIAKQILGRDASVVTLEERQRGLFKTDWNLFQFDLKQSTRFSKNISIFIKDILFNSKYQLVRYSLLLLVAIHLVILQIYSWRAQNEINILKNKISEILNQNFPEIRTVIDPVLQMQRAVDVLSTRGGQAQLRDLERILEVFGSLIQSKYAPASIEFSYDSLRLGDIGADPEILKEILVGMRSRGYSIHLDGNALLITP